MGVLHAIMVMTWGWFINEFTLAWYLVGVFGCLIVSLAVSEPRTWRRCFLACRHSGTHLEPLPSTRVAETALEAYAASSDFGGLRLSGDLLSYI